MTNDLSSSRVTPNGSAQDGQYREDAQPNAAPSATPPAVENKPSFSLNLVPAEAQTLAQAVAPRETPPIR
jgi:hypothetical protein